MFTIFTQGSERIRYQENVMIRFIQKIFKVGPNWLRCPLCGRKMHRSSICAVMTTTVKGHKKLMVCKNQRDCYEHS